MKSRCYYKCSSRYKNYGGRGITVCARWQGIDGFANFLYDVGPKPSAKYSLGRENNDGNYEPGNVRWELPDQQVRNKTNTIMLQALDTSQLITEWGSDPRSPVCAGTIRKRLKEGLAPSDAVTLPPFSSNKKFSHNGASLRLCEWAEQTGIPYQRLCKRIELGWPIAKALSEPPRVTQITINGETKTVSEWAKIAGISSRVVSGRINSLNWTPEAAVYTPVRHFGAATCKWGHSFTPENTRWAGKYRLCAMCSKNSDARRRNKKKPK